jgi:hypothetical protein
MSDMESGRENAVAEAERPNLPTGLITGIHAYVLSAASRMSAGLANSPFHALGAAIGVLAISLFLYAPRVWIGVCDERCQDAIIMAESPLHYGHLNYPLSAYRVVLPWLAYIFGLHGYRLLAIPVAANVFTSALLFRILCARTDRLVALLATSAFALSQVGQVGNTWLGWPDPICYLMLALAMSVRQRALLMPIIVIGVLTDERFIVGLAGVLVWRWAVGHESGRTPRKILRSLAAWVGLGIAGALLFRHLLTVGLIGPGIGRGVYREALASWSVNWWHRPLAVFFAFRWLWLVPASLLLRLEQLRSPHRKLIVLGLMVASCFLLTLPGDMTRSLAVIFPFFAVLIAFLYDSDAMPLAKLLATVALLNIATPMVEVFSLSIWPLYPLPAVLFRLIHGRLTTLDWPL